MRAGGVLVPRARRVCGWPPRQALLIISSILRLGKSDLPTTPIDADSFERMAACMRVLLEPDTTTHAVFLEACHATYTALLTSQASTPQETKEEIAKKARNPDALIQFRQLKPKRNAMEDADDQHEQDLTRATGTDETAADNMSKLSRIVQLTGTATLKKARKKARLRRMSARGRAAGDSPHRTLTCLCELQPLAAPAPTPLAAPVPTPGNSDAVYAEAYVNVHQYDIMLGTSMLGALSHPRETHRGASP